MNKIHIYLLILLSITIGNAFYTYHSRVKLAYIDSNRLLTNYKGMQDARKELETKINALEKNLDTLSRELQAMHADFEKKKKSMSKKEQELSAELLKTKQQQFHSYRQTFQEGLKSEDEKLTASVLNNINDLIKDYGDSHGYTIIFGAMSDGNIVYGDKGMDITDAIIEIANENYSKK